MSRNMINANKAAFNSFSERIVRRDAGAAARWIITNGTDKLWLKNVELLDEFRFDSGNSIIQCRFENLMYYVLVGFSIDELEDDAPLKFAELNAGLFTALLAEKDIILPDLDEIEIVEQALIPVGDDYKGQNWEDLRGLCKSLTLLVALSDTPLANYDGVESSLQRAALIGVTHASTLRSLPYSAQSLKKCSALASDIDSKVPWGVLAYALAAVRWDHAYLDVYRCIERLFPLPKMKELKKSLQVASPGLNLSKEIERMLGWRQAEEAGMESLFNAVDNASRRFHNAYINYWPEAPNENVARGMAQHFYKLRNSIVHFRPVTEQPPFSYERWSVVMDNFIDLVDELYREFSCEI
jgi:hypothetical protein